jgi:NTP pyrophosphatase (non-canonical NTP hydrolase)
VSTRIDHTDMTGRCFRSDHNQARLINRRRELADEKHGDQSIEAIAHDDPRWLSILVEEVGEIAHALTYDSGADPTDLADEVLDVMAVCGAWLDAFRVAGVLPDHKGAWLA